jgi:hypothetical protein
MPHIRSHLVCLALFLVLQASAAHAWFGALGKLGSAAGKAGSTAGAAGKGAAVGVAGVEVAEGANAAAQAAKAANASKAGLGVQSADDIAKASGLGKAVPDDVAAMLHSSGKTLSDIPDLGTRSWLSKPLPELSMSDANAMVRDYARLVEGKSALGPSKLTPSTAPDPLPKLKPNTEIPWQALELLFRAGHAGHQAAQLEAVRICAQRDAKPNALPLGQPRCNPSIAPINPAKK